MKDNFQLIILVVFIVAAVLGVLVFSGAIPIGTNTAQTGTGTVILWGTVKAQTIGAIIEEFNSTNESYKVQYVEKQADTFDQDLLEALASGVGPDMFFLPDDLAYHYSNKIFTIPYSTYPIASFENNFAGAGSVFLNSNGILAFPLTIDPLILYYNRSILDANNVIFPPKDWDEFAKQVQILTIKDDANKIIKSGVAMGNFTNVLHAKDILTTLFMQLGSKIISEKDGSTSSTLSQDTQLDTALKFYTDFTDPKQTIYSWNKSFQNSRDYFSTDNLAFFFGFASEFESIATKNPNQNFQIAPVPQVKNTNFKLTAANVTGIALSKFSTNFNTAFIAASQMATGDFAKQLADALGIAPARRDLLVNPPKDAYSPTFYASALYARAWLDPSPKDTDNIFRAMVESVISNGASPVNAIRDTSAKLDLLLLSKR